jgi:pimeloyl-ACP methyl ester carboxylesterase
MLKLAVSMSFLSASRSSYCAQVAVDEQGFIPVGGIDQWVAIQGNNSNNLVILFLHGGPAEAQSPFLKEFLPWEQAFTVLNWDQRGSGKTYGKNGASTPGMTVERMAQDVIEIAEYACKRLSKSKLILIGHSWGAMLGLHVIKQKPELFYAFVGTGQPVSWTLSLQDRERWTRKKATAERDEQILQNLNETAALPVDDMKRIMASGKWRMSPSDNEYLKIQSAFVGQPPLPTEGDVADWVAGGGFTMSKLGPVVFSFDARTLGLDMPLPFFVIQGRDDHTVSFDDAQAYVKEIRAPKKAFIPITGGHFACFTNPKEFIAALVKHVMPLIRP